MNPTPSPSSPSDCAPGNTLPPIKNLRWWILALLIASFAINFIDRQTFSVLAPTLRSEFHFSNTGYSYIVFAFMFGMFCMQVPMGMLLDRFGPRKILSCIVIAWSVVNALHATARSAWNFYILRFLLGNSECGNYTSGLKVISQWFPVRERALAGGLFNSGTLIGPIIAPPLVAWLAIQFNWKIAFLVTSSLGLIWLFFWWALFREPHQHPRLSREEWKIIHEDIISKADHETMGTGNAKPPAISIRQLLKYRQTWGVMLIRAFSGPFSHFYWYWLPTYLTDRGLSLLQIGLLAWIPYLGGALGNVLGGWLAGRMIRNGVSVDRARKTCFIIGGVLAATSVLIPLTPTPAYGIALICLSIFGSNFIEGNYVAIIADVFPGPVVGRLTGLTGVADNIMSMSMMLLTGILIDKYSYTPVFILVGIIPFVEILALFLGVGRIERLSFKTESEPHPAAS